jgi:hypothetical protein
MVLQSRRNPLLENEEEFEYPPPLETKKKMVMKCEMLEFKGNPSPLNYYSFRVSLQEMDLYSNKYILNIFEAYLFTIL